MTAAVEANGLVQRYGSVVAVEDLLHRRGGRDPRRPRPERGRQDDRDPDADTILAPSSGTFTVAGAPSSRPAEIRSRIGVLPESAGYPERQTGEEFLRYHARLFGHSWAGARAVADALLGDVGLWERRRSLIGVYSRGMRQRLGIARALVNAPEVVFLDEPTLGLDPAGQRQILGTVRRIARERGATVLLSTHLLAEVEETCSRLLILNRGRVAAEGTVSEIARRAAAPRSARLRIAAEHVELAAGVLRSISGIRDVGVADEQPGLVTVVLDGSASDTLMNDGLRALTEAGVPLLSFELEGARLSDAFLAMTEAA
jgi:ABC-2 type transport system ATP-binding protein